MTGSTTRHCACRDPQTGKQYGQSCPKLSQRGHGLWYLRQELPEDADGNRQTLRKGGYATKTEAQKDLDRIRALLGIADADDAEGRRAIAEMLLAAVRDKEPFPDVKETTRRFRSGQSLTRFLTVGDFLEGQENRARRKAMKAAIDHMPPFRRIRGASTRLRIRTTLRSALNDAIAQPLITVNFNPAAHVDLDSPKKPKALVWTEERIERWMATGERPSPVMVWTPDQTGQFLDHVADHRLYALWHLIAFRGLRRGEACGQPWSDTHLDTGALTVSTQLVVDGWEVLESEPKTDSGHRTVALDSQTVRVLKAHRARQAIERLEWGQAWVKTGMVFTQGKGKWLHPAWVSKEFDRLVESSGPPPIRLHDLRHGAATLALAAGAEMKTIQEMLGHSSIAITSDIYTSVLPEVSRDAAEAAARLVPRARAKASGLTSGSHRAAAKTTPLRIRRRK